MALTLGSRMGSYEIVAEIGAGGMGEVYRASDLRLRREVALKVLPHRFRFDASRRARFEREAQVLASLNHPNIATLHGIEEADGAQALVMEYVEGDSLDDLIVMERDRPAGDAGPLSLSHALSIAAQLVDALEFAHARGIVHRDLKPANIKVRPDGTVKVLDFGLAKAFALDGPVAASDATITVTDVGMVLGTPAYMSPEQARGGAVDARADIWAFGCVLFEMLTGQRVFAGDSAADVIAAVLARDPDFRRLPSGTPASIRRLLARTLAKNPTERLRHISDARFEILEARSATDVRSGQPVSHGPSHPVEGGTGWQPLWRSRILRLAALLVLVAGAGALFWWRTSTERWALRQAIPEVARLVDAGDFPAAFALADKAARYVPDDPMLRLLTPRFAMTLTIKSTPADADVYVRGYNAAGDKEQLVGRTPLEIRLPREPLRWRVAKEGFERSELATTAQADRPNGGVVEVTLDAVGQRPAEMVRVPGGLSARLVNGSMLPPITVPAFFLDRFEVTNKAFMEFVREGGYERHEFWDGLEFIKNGRTLAWADAMRLFVDSTDKPGPATWELGGYAKGHDDYPVTGVSWYEAMAYARFRGKTLPTIYHWTKAAVSNSEGGVGLSPSIVRLSNYSGRGSAAVGTYQGLGPFGTFDMAGNVREWCLNLDQSTGQPVAIGGDWRDPDYVFNFATARPAFDRSDVNGFRLMHQVEREGTGGLGGPFAIPGRTYVGEKPVPDNIFRAYLQQYAYDKADVHPSAVETIQTTSEWRQERVKIDTGYGEQMDVYMWVPINGHSPYQPLIYFPDVNPFMNKSSSSTIEPGFRNVALDFVIKSGRVLVQPVYQGSYERCCFGLADQRLFSRATFDRRKDLSRTLDYLESRADIDVKHVGFIATSFGASFAVPYLAMDDRFKAAVLISGGLPPVPLPSEIDPLNFAPRITLPVLMINGRYDQLVPKAASQEMLFHWLGTPAAKKRYCVVASGHGDIPRSTLLRETLAWLDYYLGDVDPRTKADARAAPAGGETCESARE